MKECFYCSEEIQDLAKKCRFCGEFLNVNTLNLEADKEEIKINDKIFFIKEENKKKTKIQNVVLVILILFGLITDFPNSAKGLGNLIGFVLAGYAFGYFLSWLLIKHIQGTNNKKYTMLSSIGYGIVLFSVIGGQVSSITERQVEKKEIGEIVSSISLNDDGTIDVNETGDVSSNNGKKMQEYLNYVNRSTKLMQDTIEGYENSIYSDNVFMDYSNIKNSVDEHSELIAYLEEEKGKSTEAIVKEYERIFGFPIGNEDKIIELSKKEIGFINERIKLYQVSKKIYNFYLYNFGAFEYIDGELSAGGDIYDEYEKLYINYENAFDLFEEYRQEYIKTSQDRLSDFKDKL